MESTNYKETKIKCSKLCLHLCMEIAMFLLTISLLIPIQTFGAKTIECDFDGKKKSE